MSKVVPASVVRQRNAKAFHDLQTALHDADEAERAREGMADMMASARGMGCIRAVESIWADLNRQLVTASRRAAAARKRLRATGDMPAGRCV